MAAGIAITRQDESAAELRRLARTSRDVAQARRLLAIALVMEGRSRTEAATAAGMDRQSLRDWVHRYNAEGLAGLENRRSPGPPRLLSAEQRARLASRVEAGPDPKVDRVVRWRRIDLKRWIEAEFGVVMHERTVGKQLRELGYRRLSVRSRHPKADEAAQESFKKASRRR